MKINPLVNLRHILSPFLHSDWHDGIHVKHALEKDREGKLCRKVLLWKSKFSATPKRFTKRKQSWFFSNLHSWSMTIDDHWQKEVPWAKKLISFQLNENNWQASRNIWKSVCRNQYKTSHLTNALLPSQPSSSCKTLLMRAGKANYMYRKLFSRNWGVRSEQKMCSETKRWSHWRK